MRKVAKIVLYTIFEFTALLIVIGLLAIALLFISPFVLTHHIKKWIRKLRRGNSDAIT